MSIIVRYLVEGHDIAAKRFSGGLNTFLHFIEISLVEAWCCAKMVSILQNTFLHISEISW
jgi:hypothetical protein